MLGDIKWKCVIFSGIFWFQFFIRLYARRRSEGVDDVVEQGDTVGKSLGGIAKGLVGSASGTCIAGLLLADKKMELYEVLGIRGGIFNVSSCEGAFGEVSLRKQTNLLVCAVL